MAANHEKPLFRPEAVEAWAAFLENDPPDGVRLMMRKKGTEGPGITADQALEVALCYGWIDGQALPPIDGYKVNVYTPRRKNSRWSQRNVAIAERLIAEGRMRPRGRAEVDRAKTDGRWAAAYRQKDAPVPPDFQAALDANPAAAAFFATLSGSARFAFLFRLDGVKRPETRARKIAAYVERLARGERLR